MLVANVSRLVISASSRYHPGIIPVSSPVRQGMIPGRKHVIVLIFILSLCGLLSAAESDRFTRDLAVTACFPDSQVTAGEQVEGWCKVQNQGEIAQIARLTLRIYRNDVLQQTFPNYLVQTIQPGVEVFQEFIPITMSQPDCQYKFTFSVSAQGTEPDEEPEDNELSTRINTWTTQQQQVVMEVAAGSFLNIFDDCYGAILAEAGLSQIVDDLAILNYQVTPPYASDGGDARVTSYGITTFPTAIFGGLYRSDAASSTASLLSTYYPLVLQASARKAPFEIGIYGYHTGIIDELSIRLERQGFLDNDDLYIYWALVQDNLPVDWMGFTNLDDVVGYIQGEQLPATAWAGDHYTLTRYFPWQSEWLVPNCRITVFVQQGQTGRIIQANSVALNQLQPPVTVEDPIAEDRIRIYPNPGVNDFQFELQNVNEVDTNLSIYNLRGQRVRQLFTGKLNQGKQILSWDGCDDHGSKVRTGVYIVRLNTSGIITNKRVTLCR